MAPTRGAYGSVLRLPAQPTSIKTIGHQRIPIKMATIERGATQKTS
jgi:hypothetical protein